MSLSVKSKYGISAVFELALHINEGPIQIRHLAASRNIPQRFLEQILVDLKQHNIVKSTRGARGGYVLAKHPRDISVLDVLHSLDATYTLGEGYCGCDTLSFFWSEVDDALVQKFSTNFEMLVDRKKRADQILTFNI